MKIIVQQDGFDDFRVKARGCLAQAIAPAAVHFESAHEVQSSLFGQTPVPPAAPAEAALGTPSFKLPRQFVSDAQVVAVHSEAARYDLMYRIIWRLTHGEPQLLQDASDDDVLSFSRLCKAVHRDVHKCHAYVRFRAVADADAPGAQHWVAYYQPDYRILPLAAPHFVARFGQMPWSILTPDASVVHRDAQTLFGPGCPRQNAPTQDALEELWRIYYTSIFNPARLNRRAMMQEMPRRYWQGMPETQLIDQMIQDAPKRTQAFLSAQPPQAPTQSEHKDLASLHAATRACRVCDWCAQSTQVVVGEGAPNARVMFVGEQPGDQEDRVGRPFVGPAGQLFDAALKQAGINRDEVFVTNAVKHFKWTEQRKRRLHQKPNAGDVAACRPWLVGEIRLVQPEWLVCLGTTAALAVLGKAVRLKDVRAQVLSTPACAQTLCTTHPSAVLRTPPEAQKAAFDALVADLRLVATRLHAATG